LIVTHPGGVVISCPFRPMSFFECVCESRTSGGARIPWIINPCFPQAPSGVHESQTHSKINKTKKSFKIFFFCLFLNVFVNQERQGSRISRVHVSLKHPQGFMNLKHIQK
jgi:hypothetical protein